MGSPAVAAKEPPDAGWVVTTPSGSVSVTVAPSTSPLWSRVKLATSPRQALPPSQAV